MAVKFTKPEINVREKLAELDKPSGIAGEAMLRAETPQEQNDLIGANLNNIIINGDFQVWQRGTTFTTGNKFTADRWYLYGNGTTNETVTQQTDVPKDSGNSYSLRITAGGVYAGGNYAMLRYKVEPKDLIKLNNAVGSTLQFWIKADNPGLYTIMFLQHRSSGSQRQISRTYMINSSDVWEFKTVTIPADSTVLYDANTTMLTIDWVYGKNSSYSTGTFNDASWANNVSANRQPTEQTNAMSASGKKFSISGVQFVPGKYPSGLPHLHRSYGEELALCKRYYEILKYDTSTDSGGGAAAETLIANGFAYTTTRSLNHLKFNVIKRTQPTVTIVGGVAKIEVLDTTGGWVTTTAFTARANIHGTRLDLTHSSSLTAGNALEVRILSGGYLNIDAEL